MGERFNLLSSASSKQSSEMSDPELASGASAAPVALFVYNRPEHTRRALKSLAACHGAVKADLTVFSDAAKTVNAQADVKAVRDVVANVDGFRSVEIVERPSNMGSAGSVIDGIKHMLSRHEYAIFMEDDLVCAPYALSFLNKALKRYADQPNIFTVSAYSYPARLMEIPESYTHDAYFSPVFSSWGWATWRRSLDYIDWDVSDYEAFRANPDSIRAFRHIRDDLPELLAEQQKGQSDDWTLPMAYSQFKNNFLTLCPVHSLIDNIGHDGSGLHCFDTELFRNDIDHAGDVISYPDAIYLDDRIMDASRTAFSNSFLTRVKRRILDQSLKLRRARTKQS
ncbi:MAG: glycosyltransferase [Hyphomicrobiaceae bacterium]|nr:glycosyltransferase [Hyphomicrobiaceae bacterium]